jgi:GxxExxY protein
MIRLRVASPLPEDVEELVHVTIGACIAVHEELGPGLLESIYARAVAIELASRKIPFETEHLIPIVYREQVPLVTSVSICLLIAALFWRSSQLSG